MRLVETATLADEVDNLSFVQMVGRDESQSGHNPSPRGGALLRIPIASGREGSGGSSLCRMYLGLKLEGRCMMG